MGLRKLIDDTNMGRMNLESEIEALKEELIHLKKNHDNVSPQYRLCERQSHGKKVEAQGQPHAQVVAIAVFDWRTTVNSRSLPHLSPSKD